MIGKGWLLAETGEAEAGVTKIQQALKESTGSSIYWPWFLSLLANAQGKQGQIDAGLCAIATGLDALYAHEVFLWESHLLRLKGDLLMKQSPVDAAQAEDCFQQALDVAGRHQAKSWGL